MDMSKVEGTNMLKEHGHPTNHQLGEEGMKTVEEHDHPTNHQLEKWMKCVWSELKP
jgi:hypothetical protein